MSLDTETRFTGDFEPCVEEAVARSKDLLRMAILRGARYADLFLEQTRTTALRAGTTSAGQKSRPLHSPTEIAAHEEITGGMGFRVFDRQTHRVGSVTGWRPGAWTDAVSNAAAGLTGEGDAEWTFAAESKWIQRLPPDAPDAISLEEKKNLLSVLMESARAYNPSIARCTMTFNDETRRTLLVNSRGQAVVREQGRCGVRLEIALRAFPGNPAYAIRGSFGGYGNLAFDDHDAFIIEAVDRAERMSNARQMAEGAMPVVFAGGSGGLWLHEAVGHLLEADVASKALTRGKNIGNACLTVFDDATFERDGVGSLVDDEGVPGERTVLIAEGRLENLLTDRFFSERHALRLTGNGRRAHFRDLPLPRMTALCLQPGPASNESLIASVSHGLYVMQASSGAHYDATGAFEINVLDGFRIEGGRLSHPVTNVVISGRSPRVLQQIAVVGRDARWDRGFWTCEKAGQVLPVSVNAPSVLIDGLQVRQG